ncbi:MAG: hypothetical protein COX46_03035 [bacterium (Candidatus Ratteibacteria) CG23_combo_of_CG06-09_8_20_14_all_48_7]|uniref:DUF6922 domain-containing protein n=1 Tax=bacterium (Candidatus Ratteibacteria) CG23_combo_of_CG06-09_8_20_14_all_48_7 TaxID=2014292 RepID=A0A2G9YAT8_9BACT|nr:MAG: hypothetical protein COX46_03035 [bacterium (Candidatus Ratteibacteria) CG23_combo_of_CG06-09_8_20_14_all_48_7]
MSAKRLPGFLQPFLWSVKIDELDLKKDKIYIINQILAFGDIEALRWLFKNYSSGEIRNVFLNHSLKIYRDSGFHFVKNILLEIKRPLNSQRYVAASL